MFYPYLSDQNFLKLFDSMTYSVQYIRITILDFYSENEIAFVEGKATGGSISISGTSSLRRSGSCSICVPDFNQFKSTNNNISYSNLLEINNLFSINKKIRLEVGRTNTLNEYIEYPIIWIPLGVYIIKNASVNQSNSGINISLTLNDKSAQLNGTVGGTIPAATIFSEKETISLDQATRTVEYPLIIDIIRSLVVEFGGERSENVIIEGVPEAAKKVLKWYGDVKAYLIKEDKKKLLTTDKAAVEEYQKQGRYEDYEEYEPGSLIGYEYVPFVYPGTLECNAGDTVATILDKIKNMLGNHEWFYDAYGRFHFQEIQNYRNNRGVASDINTLDYFSSYSLTNSVYRFDSQQLITAISVNPQYDNIKNDFIVWGSAKTSTGASKPIRYHVAFQSKPIVRTMNPTVVLYYDPTGRYNIISDHSTNIVYTSPMTDPNKIYINNKKIYTYNSQLKHFTQNKNFNYIQLQAEYFDWRTELFMQSIENTNVVFADNPYAAELKSEFLKICSRTNFEDALIKGGWESAWPLSYSSNIENYEYWLDFIDPSSNPMAASLDIAKIGRRTKIVTDSNISCLFNPQIPSYCYIQADGDIEKEKSYVAGTGYEVIQVAPEIWQHIAVGSIPNSAYDKMLELIQTHTHYNEKISLTTLPIYHLEPNTLIEVVQDELGINGQYLVNNITIPLALNGTSTISASKCVQRTF